MRIGSLRMAALTLTALGLAGCATPPAGPPAQLTCRAGAYVMSYAPQPVDGRAGLVGGPVERRAVAFCDDGAMALVTIAGIVQTDRDGRGSMTTEWVWRFDHGATMALKSSGTMVPDAQRITRYEERGEVAAATGAMAPHAGGAVTMSGRSFTRFDKDNRGDAAFVFVIRRP
jgi:hypothetical protein